MTVVDMRSLEGNPVLIEDAKHEAEKLVMSAAETLVTNAAGALRQSGYEVFSEIGLGVPIGHDAFVPGRTHMERREESSRIDL
jgi:hypothetical protein